MPVTIPGRCNTLAMKKRYQVRLTKFPSAVAQSLGVEVRPIAVHDAGETERAVTAFARPSKGGLIVAGGSLYVFHRDVITSSERSQQHSQQRRAISKVR